MHESRPLFSIIIPTHSRPEQLARCLGAVARLDYPRERFEVIVVDDGSVGDVRAVHAAVAQVATDVDITLVGQRRSGPATARNTGAARARGRFLAFTDDDCAPAPDWLRALEARFEADPTCAVGGLTINALPADLYSTASQLLIDYLYSYYNIGETGARFFATNNLALPADRFHATGGFDLSFPLAAAEDRDFCERWRARGWAMVYADEVVVYHAHRLRLGTFCRQHFNYGRGAFYLHRARAGRGGRTVRLEPPSFYTNLIRYPLSRERGPRALALCALLAVSQAAYAAGYYSERARHLPARAVRVRRPPETAA